MIQPFTGLNPNPQPQSARLPTGQIALLTFSRPSSATGSGRENAVEFRAFENLATGDQKLFIP
jgi:hypothetical protein